MTKYMSNKKTSIAKADFETLKVAFTYDKLTTFGGAERVLLALHQAFPHAPIYTAIHNSRTASWASSLPQIHTSYLQNAPLAQTHPQLYAPLIPFAFEKFDFSDYDVVISVTSYDAKSIITHPNTLHICYCLTPNRYLWVDPGYSSYKNFSLLSPLIHALKSPVLSWLRVHDQLASTRPDHYLTISEHVQARVNKFYRRSSQIIYPPVDTDFFIPSQTSSSNYFLIVGRLTPYKQIDQAILACNQLKVPLKIAGTGPDYDRLKRLIEYPQIQLLGFQTNQQLRQLYQNCSGLLMPQTEDFGIVGLEALACGKPVITNTNSGIAELITPSTGIHIANSNTKTLIRTLKNFDSNKFSAQDCRSTALQYSNQKFSEQFKAHVDKLRTTKHSPFTYI